MFDRPPPCSADPRAVAASRVICAAVLAAAPTLATASPDVVVFIDEDGAVYHCELVFRRVLPDPAAVPASLRAGLASMHGALRMADDILASYGWREQDMVRGVLVSEDGRTFVALVPRPRVATDRCDSTNVGGES